MSCNYAEGLSNYENKGVLGVPEVFDDETTINEKTERLAKLILSSKHVVVHTGAGISTSAGIPDFRGPNGVWTLEEKGEKPNINVSFDDAQPTLTHMALKSLVKSGHIKYIISQNIDGLHLKSGIHRNNISELHGNMFIDQCNKCYRQFIRNQPTETVGQKPTGGICRGGRARPCRGGYLIDTILDWEADLPDKDLDLAYMHSSLADLNLCLGTTLQIVPSGNLPLKNKKYDGKLVICNLQPTKHNKKADMVISGYVDIVMKNVMKKMSLEIDEYSADEDPTKQINQDVMEWTISSDRIKEVEKTFNQKSKEFKENAKKRKIDLKCSPKLPKIEKQFE